MSCESNFLADIKILELLDEEDRCRARQGSR